MIPAVASQTAWSRAAAVAPLALLTAYGVAFAAAALGRSLPVYDDHPGQLYRLAHAPSHSEEEDHEREHFHSHSK